MNVFSELQSHFRPLAIFQSSSWGVKLTLWGLLSLKHKYDSPLAWSASVVSGSPSHWSFPAWCSRYDRAHCFFFTLLHCAYHSNKNWRPRYLFGSSSRSSRHTQASWLCISTKSYTSQPSTWSRWLSTCRSWSRDQRGISRPSALVLGCLPTASPTNRMHRFDQSFCSYACSKSVAWWTRRGQGYSTPGSSGRVGISFASPWGLIPYRIAFWP